MTKIEALKIYVKSLKSFMEQNAKNNILGKEYYETCAKTFEVVLDYVEVVEEDPTLE